MTNERLNVGDIIIRTGPSYDDAINGNEYIIDKLVATNYIKIKGSDNFYNSDLFTKSHKNESKNIIIDSYEIF